MLPPYRSTHASTVVEIKETVSVQQIRRCRRIRLLALSSLNPYATGKKTFYLLVPSRFVPKHVGCGPQGAKQAVINTAMGMFSSPRLPSQVQERVKTGASFWQGQLQPRPILNRLHGVGTKKTTETTPEGSIGVGEDGGGSNENDS